MGGVLLLLAPSRVNFWLVELLDIRLPLRVIPPLRQVRESGFVLTKHLTGCQLAQLDSPMLAT
jgi:hypothetical protein